MGGEEPGEGGEAGQGPPTPPHDAPRTCSSGAAGAWSTFWNSASRQAVWSCCSRTRARIRGRARLLSICAKLPWTSRLTRSSSSSDREKAAEQSRLRGKSRGVAVCVGWPAAGVRRAAPPSPLVPRGARGPAPGDNADLSEGSPTETARDRSYVRSPTSKADQHTHREQARGRGERAERGRPGARGPGVKKPAPPAADTAPGMPRAALGTVGNTVTLTCRVRRGRKAYR